MMKIGILCHSSFGGSARVATELARHLADEGHSVHVFSESLPFGEWDAVPNRKLHYMIDALEVNHQPANLHTEWSHQEIEQFTDQVLTVVTEERLDILHYHYAVPFAMIAANVKTRLGDSAPVIVGTLHGTDVIVHSSNPVVQPHISEALQHTEAVTAVSANLGRLAFKRLRLKQMPIIIHNFIDLERFKPSPSAAQGSLNRRPVIAHISNFRSVKNTLDVARIFLQVRRHIDVQLWLIGEGQDLQAVRGILDNSPYHDDVRYLGLQQDVVPYLQQADMLLMTSHYESFCLVALEAMACGIPVLASEVGGISEVVLHNRTGFLYPPASPNLGAQFGVKLLTDPELYEQMSTAALERAKDFTHQNVVTHYT
jgi:N-acetyl-alpha-D-glucosaminyl L-malate synthase BshA